EMLLGPLRQSKNAVFSVWTLVPRLEPDERQRRVLSATGEVEAGDGKYRVDHIALFGQQILTHRIYGLLGTLGRRTHGCLNLGKQYALIFVWQERAGQPAEQHRQRRNDDQINDDEGDLALQYGYNALLVAIHAA